MNFQQNLPCLPGDSVYKFRAECVDDALLFIRTAYPHISHWGMVAEKQLMFEPEVMIVVKGNMWTLPQLTWLANQITDCHVIADTIQHAQEYTGIRNYSPVMTQPSQEQLAVVTGYVHQVVLSGRACDRTRMLFEKLCSYQQPRPMANHSSQDERKRHDMVSRNESRILTREETEYIATQFRKITSHCWYDDKERRHVFFTGDHCYMYLDLPRNVVSTTSYLPMSVAPRPGLEDGIVRTFDDYLRVFEYDSNIHYSKGTASLQLGMPLK